MHCQELQFFFGLEIVIAVFGNGILNVVVTSEICSFFISPHTTFELWAICSAVPKNVSLLIFGSGVVFVFSRSQYLLFHAFCKFLTN